MMLVLRERRRHQLLFLGSGGAKMAGQTNPRTEVPYKVWTRIR